MTVGLFIPCLVDQFFPDIGDAVVDIFEKLGVPARYPQQQTCCGLPFYNMGHHEAAVGPAAHFMDVFEGYDAVVTPSSSCAAMIKHYYPRLFAAQASMKERAERLAAKTFELSSYIVNEAGTTDLGASYEGSVACHRSCHLRELGARDEAEQLIKGVRGAEFVQLQRVEMCCGFGGSFAVKFPLMSGTMGQSKCDSIEQSKADCVVTTDAGCMLQINGVLRRRSGEGGDEGGRDRDSPAIRRVYHLAELLVGRVPSPSSV